MISPYDFRSPLALNSGGASHVSSNQHYQLQQTVSTPLQQQQQQQQQSQQQHLMVPNAGASYLRPNLSPPQPVLLAPPDASQLAQRRFSEVDAAIDRHNLRRQAKRSQSVMYRQNQQMSHGRNRSRSKRSGRDVNTNDVEVVAMQQRRRESRSFVPSAAIQQAQLL